MLWTYGWNIDKEFVALTPAFRAVLSDPNLWLPDGRHMSTIVQHEKNHIDHFHWRMKW